ncbi:MAG TPA: hypothetical protein VKY85_00555 [Candidatus Angelobacter sp.]|nr:hypothetical protein [Candidatus Angelobacter sp.]
MSLVRVLQKLISNLWMALVLWGPVLAPAQSPSDIGELFASETTAHGPVLLAGTGMSVASGSQVAAGKSVATLRLARGGEVRICPNAGLTASAVQNNVPQGNQELMLSMDTGALEIDYPLNDMADTLITPDFKLMLAGPGVFHFALGVNNQGDTCIKPLRGNSASLIVSEMLGNGVYQVKPDEAVIFARGKLSGRGSLETACGCPVPTPLMQANQNDHPLQSEHPKQTEPSPARIASDVTAPMPAEKPDAIHVQVEAPLVFLGNQPEPVYAVARIRFSALPNVFLPQENEKPVVLKPGKGEVSAKVKEKKGFFGRIKGFFASLFHK